MPSGSTTPHKWCRWFYVDARTTANRHSQRTRRQFRTHHRGACTSLSEKFWKLSDTSCAPYASQGLQSTRPRPRTDGAAGLPSRKYSGKQIVEGSSSHAKSFCLISTRAARLQRAMPTSENTGKNLQNLKPIKAAAKTATEASEKSPRRLPTWENAEK